MLLNAIGFILILSPSFIFYEGSGVVDLRYFIDCVEAPVTDHKKATNVFLLLAKERGFFDQASSGNISSLG